MYTAVDSGVNMFVETLQKNCPAPTTLELKVGAQVMLVKNLAFGKELVNGARYMIEKILPAALFIFIFIIIIFLTFYIVGVSL